MTITSEMYLIIYGDIPSMPRGFFREFILAKVSSSEKFLFITNIPEDLDGIDEGYLEKEINDLNKKAFVIVILVHPMASDELRTIPYR